MKTERKSPNVQNDVIQFLRKRDYALIRELGQGGCGRTVLLRDDQIGEYFVCKKYAPHSEADRLELFANFVREIKLLHKIHHQNVVRVFNHYLYPDQLTGYILMEFVDGQNIDDFVAQSPEQTNEVFLQTISGFGYLERIGILHRDIRPGNLMVRTDGVVKIIDLGFGKEVRASKDFEKSISLNWWCQPPKEFEESRYDFRSEVYFVGKLFEKLLQENAINHFKYASMLARMCNRNPDSRIQTFVDVEKEIGSNKFFEIEFAEADMERYRTFARVLCSHIAKIHSGAKYKDDIGRIESQLNDAYRGFMLEENVPDPVVVVRCILDGTYYYRNPGFPVPYVRDFLHLLKSSTEEKKRIILANLHTKLDALPRYTEASEDDDVPF